MLNVRTPDRQLSSCVEKQQVALTAHVFYTLKKRNKCLFLVLHITIRQLFPLELQLLNWIT